MTIWAAQSQVLKAVVQPAPVDMIQLERDWLTIPLRATAILTTSLLQTFTDQAQFQLMCLRGLTIDQ
jgi:hypothetical protein